MEHIQLGVCDGRVQHGNTLGILSKLGFRQQLCENLL
jgi:hypothetical protein